MTKPFTNRVLRPIQEFLQTEASGGAALLLAMIVGLLLANLPTRDLYHDVITADLNIDFGGLHFPHNLEHWVSDGLMTLFFFVVGLEIKRELVDGELRDRRKAALPVIGAVGGMVVPAALYAVVNIGEPGLRGWGIPVATDIAFAIGVCTVLGRRVPSSAKIFLLTLAIADDIGGILVIALAYSESISGAWLGAAVAGVLGVWAMQRIGIAPISPYVVVGVVLWIATYQSGVHATIAGVVLGFMTPLRASDGRKVLVRLEHAIHPWSSYLVIPLFALANSGIELSADAIGDAFSASVTWGIILGLLVGKTAGIGAAVAIGVRTGLGRMPTGMAWQHVVGLSMLAGIGFTVALFIGNLSFPDDDLLREQAKIGIFFASFAAAALGSLWLMYSPRSRAKHPTPA